MLYMVTSADGAAGTMMIGIPGRPVGLRDAVAVAVVRPGAAFGAAATPTLLAATGAPGFVAAAEVSMPMPCSSSSVRNKLEKS